MREDRGGGMESRRDVWILMGRAEERREMREERRGKREEGGENRDEGRERRREEGNGKTGLVIPL